MRTREEDCEDEEGLLYERPKQRTEKPWKIWMVSIVCLVSGFILGAVFSTEYTTRSKPHKSNDNTSSNSGGKSHNISASASSIFPINIPVTFEPNDMFSNYSDPETDKIWEALIPRTYSLRFSNHVPH
ncbi:uncharacterized protein BDR25DRAFT_315416 [Lindgomyces ingoldianus]|uniref:Uncharacterized protein n=1 Tax=Lindgomyces ingoldianus TaxID=673940 RepID=A0ACB6QQY3_9PLEO|nr:uncharacterized protein BDR25DRAFT_315416 [Lindgomyces ingoldianus]KAF2469429.1 hypothetical protein BDR25DRAFT_315416 [Lindgomyces ingoldianus]